MTKQELRVELLRDVERFLENRNKVTVLNPNKAPASLTAFVRVSPGSNGNRVDGSRLGSKAGRLS